MATYPGPTADQIGDAVMITLAALAVGTGILMQLWGPIMSLWGWLVRAARPAAAPAAGQLTASLQQTAKPKNEDKAQLPEQPLPPAPSAVVPDNVREIIRHQARAEAVAALVRAGLITNRSKAICSVWACSVAASTRPDTPYQRALTSVNELLDERPQVRGPDGQPQPMTYPVTKGE